jgi:PST family polysaccharide transporter
MKYFPAQLLRSQVVQNTAALYGVQISRKLVPLIIVPYLARTLGPAGWGTVAFAQSLGEFIVLVIEFGFNLSATRAIARNRESKESCGEIVAGVLGAQVLLALAVGGAAILVSRWIPLLRENPKLLAAGLFYAAAQGFMPLWFFQGLEKLRLAAELEITGKLLGMCAVLLLVRRPEDGWIALFVQGLAPALCTTVGIALAYRAIPFRWPSWPLVRDAVHLGWRMFVFRSGESLYGVGNTFVLGLFAPPDLVGYFASAEKISKAAFGLLNPIREALYPRISHMVSNSPVRAAHLIRIGAIVSISGGILLGASLLLFAPLLIAVLMGPGFAAAITVLRILSVLPPLLAITHSVGLQWLLPRGRDAEVTRIILSAGALNLALAVLLAPRFAHLGMAWAVVCAEAFVCFRMVRAVAHSRSSFRDDRVLSSCTSLELT